jgi:biotin carboxylase
MKNVLIACATRRDKRELSFDHVRDGFNVFFYSYNHANSVQKIVSPHAGFVADAFDPLTVIEEVTAYASALNIQGITASDDYPASLIAPIVAQSFKLPAPHPVRTTLCHHAYYARQAQQKYTPEAVPSFCIINPREPQLKNFNLGFPFLIKPVKARSSAFTNVVHNWHELRESISTNRFPQEFVRQFNWFLRNYLPGEYDIDHLLAETFLEGSRVMLEGYVYKGEIEILGIIDAIMYQATMVVQRLEYPSSLEADIQERMAHIAKKCVAGIGLDNTLFSLELVYNSSTDTIHIVELNPYMNSQVADLFEKVDGFNTYTTLLQVATGTRPLIVRKKGVHQVAASFVLCTFQDAQVVKIPSEQQQAYVRSEFPDLRLEVLAHEGERLYPHLQDGVSYRYGLINIGGTSREKLYASFERCKELLTFAFKP